MSNRKYLCFPCRVCVRREASTASNPRCPHCGGDTVNIGYRIPVPPKKDVKRWRELEQDLALVRLEREQASTLSAARRIHEIEKEIARLETLPENPGRRSLIRRLAHELTRLRS